MAKGTVVRGHIFDTLKDWIHKVPEKLKNPVENLRMRKEMPSK